MWLYFNIVDKLAFEIWWVKESGINTEFFNFSMLNKELLKKARDYIFEIYNKLIELKGQKEFIKEKIEKNLRKN